MKFCVFGLGAIGGFVAARLALAGHPVSALARGATLSAVRERGLTPGRDVSITGFDDLPDAGFLGLTTVSQPIAEKGRLAARLAMDPDYPDRQILLPVELKVRASTGPAPLN